MESFSRILVVKKLGITCCALAALAPSGVAQLSAPPATNIVFPPAAASMSGVTPETPSTSDSAVRLGSGDLIEVSVYGVPELNTKTRVSQAGEVYLPLVNYVHVGGLTINDAESVIEKRLDQGGFVKNPHVLLFVDEYNSQGVSLLGEVTRPGVYPVLGDQKLLDVISAAGGFTEKTGNSITVTHRDQPAKPVLITILH